MNFSRYSFYSVSMEIISNIPTPPGIFGGVEETTFVLDSNGLPVVFRYHQGGWKT